MHVKNCMGFNEKLEDLDHMHRNIQFTSDLNCVPLYKEELLIGTTKWFLGRTDLQTPHMINLFTSPICFFDPGSFNLQQLNEVQPYNP